MMIVACSIVVRSAASGAVLRTAWASEALIFGASLPIDAGQQQDRHHQRHDDQHDDDADDVAQPPAE